jgi:hypothetical protein
MVPPSDTSELARLPTLPCFPEVWGLAKLDRAGPISVSKGVPVASE